MRFKEEIDFELMTVPKKILKIPLRMLISVLLIGILFKFQHWPYSNLIMTCAFTGIVILYPFRFWYKRSKKPIDIVKLVLVVFWSLNGIFTVWHFPYRMYFQIITLLAFFAWLILEGPYYFSKGNKAEDKPAILTNVIFMLAMVLTIAGALLKIQHWPYSTYLLIGGLGIGAVWCYRSF